MTKHRPALAMLSMFVFALLVGREASAALDRAPEILDHRQDAATSQIRLIWAPGGNADGTINPNVTSYAVEIKGDGYSAFTPIFWGDGRAMTYVDPLGWTSWGFSAWNPANQGATVTYRIKATTSDAATSYSPEATFTPALPLYPPNEVLDGKVQLAWQASVPRPPYNTHLGYRVQKKVADGVWIDAHVGFLTDTTFIDPQPTIGTNVYRVLSMYAPTGTAVGQQLDRINHLTLTSNEQEIVLQPTCAGQVVESFTPALEVVEITDRDADGAYTGSDIVDALELCAAKTYTRADGTILHGGCVLRALPVTYENVAIKITYHPNFCTTPYFVSYPIDCLLAGPGQPMDFAAGLVIEGHGSRSIFRSPLWTPPYMPGAIFEVHHQQFPVSMRNIVLDGRKHEQQAPGMSAWSAWYHAGLIVWSVNPWNADLVEVSGDSLGNDDPDGYCNVEYNPFPDKTCAEATTGNDGDGRCEAGENCVDALGGSCDAESWANAVGCETRPEWQNNDGCLHNVEVRNIFSEAAVAIAAARRWIVEDSDLHDIGCVNRGYGYDCPYLDGAADLLYPPGFKTFGIGLNVAGGTSDFKVRRNEVYRVTKYGLSFKNQAAQDCNNLLRNHEIAYNDVHDVGAVGIFNYGTVGARVHHNTIGRTTNWNEPASMNGSMSLFGMSLGGFCSDDNQFSDNYLSEGGGIAILWDGSTERVACSAPGVCAPVAEIGNVIQNTTINGACLEKDTAPPGGTFGFGAIQTIHDASGTLLLKDNDVANSNCAHPIAVFGQDPWTQPFELEVEGGTYESGASAWSAADNSFYCGAVHAHGDNRKIVIGDDVEFTNPTGPANIPKACLGYGAKVVIDDVPDDPFSPGPFTAPSVSGGASVVSCSTSPTDPDCM